MILKSNKHRRGNIATSFVSMIAIALIVYAFVQYMDSNIVTMKHENISQYSRDTMLILESEKTIQKSYLLDVKSKLTDKLGMKTSESLQMQIKIGNGSYYDVTTMPTSITPNYNDDIDLKITYVYRNNKISYTGEYLHPITVTNMETMVVDTPSKCKNRGNSDG